MRVYEDVTGKRVPFAKGGSNATGAEQHSTEFISRSLKKIDPTISVLTSMTLINNALKSNGNINIGKTLKDGVLRK